MINLDKKVFIHFDFLIPIFVLPLIVLSFFLIQEENYMLSYKQVIYFSIGFLMFALFFILPLRKYEWLIPFFYYLSILLLISVEFFGVTKLGAQRWLEVPFTSFTIQPSEIFKPAFILMLAYLVKQNPPNPDSGYSLKEFLKLSMYIIIPFILIAKEPDLGTALVLLIVGFGTLFVIGVNKKIWLSLLVILGLLSPLLYSSLKPYQKKRVNDFLSHVPSYNVKQSIIAIGSGGISGQSKEETTQTHLKFLPIATSDFIFSYMVERFGFISALIVVIMYLILIIHLLTLNFKLKNNYFARVVTTSIAFLIFIYMAINIAMNIGLAPVVGLPLPFLSYGGSSFVTFMILFGILENTLTFRFDSLYSSIKFKF